MARYKGYMGSFLRVNVTTGKVSIEPLSEELVRQFVGGRGMGAKILYDEVSPGIDPFSPLNKLIFTTGPLASTVAQSCNRWMVTTKSPLTGGMFRSTAGGGFGAEVKSAGFDILIVEGKADRPVYIMIQDDTVEIKDARHLMGMLTHEATSAIQEELQDEKVKIAVIGPSGEKLVRFAAIVDGRRTAARGGVGAVMGSKNVKAIAVRGSKRVAVADHDKLLAITRKQADIVRREPKYAGFKHLGTASAVGFCHELGIYPVKNFQDGCLKMSRAGLPETRWMRFLSKTPIATAAISTAAAFCRLKAAPMPALRWKALNMRHCILSGVSWSIPILG